jgi:hypothetical protein
MTKMRHSRFPARRTACLSLWLVAGCISDPAVEADVPASQGITQPDGGGGAKLTAAEACDRMTSARAAAAKKLGCDDPGDRCPRYLFVAGAAPCTEYTEGSVDACVAVIDSYDACKDFSERACVATPVAGSCRPLPVPDGGRARLDSGADADLPDR